MARSSAFKHLCAHARTAAKKSLKTDTARGSRRATKSKVKEALHTDDPDAVNLAAYKRSADPWNYD